MCLFRLHTSDNFINDHYNTGKTLVSSCQLPNIEQELPSIKRDMDQNNRILQDFVLSFCLSGSPADRADLEIGDEILEVNGRSLEDATHEEVIKHIHQVR